MHEPAVPPANAATVHRNPPLHLSCEEQEVRLDVSHFHHGDRACGGRLRAIGADVLEHLKCNERPKWASSKC